MNKKGFTLLEVIAVILIMGISSLGLVTVMQQVLFNVHKPQVMQVATGLAEKEAERVLNLEFPSVVNEYFGAPASYGGGFSAYSRQTRVTDVDSDNKIVEIRVHHIAVGYVWLAFLKTDH
jgi:prepilin-type N-terminal cleavage/methylation domain-containing protein